MPINPQNRQTVVISGICLLIVVAALIFVYGFPSLNSKSGSLSTNLFAPAASQDISTSTDWQKSFFDISSSSQAYKSGIDSLNTFSTSTGPLTNTDILGRNFLVTYSQMRQVGLSSDAKTIDTVATNLATNSLSNLEKPKAYYMSDLTIVSDSTLDLKTVVAIGNYATFMTGIFNNFPTPAAEADIANEAFDKNNMSLLKNIDPIISTYKKTISSLLSIPVPQSASQYHLDLINGFSSSQFISEALRNLDADPVRGLNAVGQEMQTLQLLSTATQNIQQYLQKESVTLSKLKP